MAQSKPSPGVTLPFLYPFWYSQVSWCRPILPWKFIYCPPDLSFCARITLVLHHYLDRALGSVTTLSQSTRKPINAVLNSFSSSQDPRGYQQALLSLPTIQFYHRTLSAEPTQHLEHRLSRANSKGPPWGRICHSNGIQVSPLLWPPCYTSIMWPTWQWKREDPQILCVEK